MPTVYGPQTVTGALTGQGAVTSSGQLTSAGGLVVSGGLGGLLTPTITSVTQVGTAGTTAYAYRIAAVNSGNLTAASTEVTTATGNLTLSGTNYNLITFPPVAGATSYRIYGRYQGDEALIGTVASDGRTGNYTYSDTTKALGGAPAAGINPVPNSSFNSNTALWNLLNATLVRDQTRGQPVAGVSAALLTSTSATAGWAQNSQPAGTPAQMVAVTAGTTYTITLYVYLGTVPSVSLAVQWWSAANAVLSASNSSSVGSTTGWTRYVLTAAAPTNAVGMNIYVGISNTAVGQTAWIAAPQVDVGSVPSAYQLDIPAPVSAANIAEWRDGNGNALSRIDVNGYLWEGANRVYSAANPPPAAAGNSFASIAKLGVFS